MGARAAVVAGTIGARGVAGPAGAAGKGAREGLPAPAGGAEGRPPLPC